MIDLSPLAPARPAAVAPGDAGDAALRDAATRLEASFLAEMLKSAGLHETNGPFGGGTGEDQFNSLLVRAQAEDMARAGGIGLAEQLFQALKARDNGGV